MTTIDNNIDKLDRKILNILMQDARTPYLEIARSCNVSGATVHLRIQKLEKTGIIRGSRLIVDPAKLGVGICAYLGIYLDRGSQFNEVVHELKKSLKSSNAIIPQAFTPSSPKSTVVIPHICAKS